MKNIKDPNKPNNLSALFEIGDCQIEVARGIAELRELFDEFRRIKLETGILYFGSDTDDSEEVCLAYTNLNETILVRVGDEVVISQVDEVGYIEEISYIPDLEEIHCIIDLGEEYERLVDISPSAISDNITLRRETGIGD